MKSGRTRIARQIRKLEKEGRFAQERKFYQHGKTTIYEHSVRVATESYRFAKKYRLKVDYDSLIRGALLHDYFLYDWHEKDHGHRLHGFRHPRTALKNAERDFELTDIERNIIECHMFPLTLIPPRTVEAWIVCLQDTLCAADETVTPRMKRVKKAGLHMTRRAQGVLRSRFPFV